MKKLPILSVAFLLSFVPFILATVPHAFATANPTIIRGNVYDVIPSGLSPLKGLEVRVTCHGDNKNITKHATTDANGLFSVNFSDVKCDQGSQVAAEMQFNGQITIEKVYTSSVNTATINFYF